MPTPNPTATGKMVIRNTRGNNPTVRSAIKAQSGKPAPGRMRIENAHNNGGTTTNTIDLVALTGEASAVIYNHNNDGGTLTNSIVF